MCLLASWSRYSHLGFDDAKSLATMATSATSVSQATALAAGVFLCQKQVETLMYRLYESFTPTVHTATAALFTTNSTNQAADVTIAASNALLHPQLFLLQPSDRPVIKW